ncbi:hypothetical protein EDB52_101433 [Vibrio crassostreae]|nr:hypothetical protein EDB52_101433 [Vibrio crassostreae]TQK40098.1 hypothetical protein FB441_0714 [Vibrio crassostreae]
MEENEKAAVAAKTTRRRNPLITSAFLSQTPYGLLGISNCTWLTVIQLFGISEPRSSLASLPTDLI